VLLFDLMKQVNPFFDIPGHAPAFPERILIFVQIRSYFFVPPRCVTTYRNDIQNFIL
jgi:hypothetical protein